MTTKTNVLQNLKLLRDDAVEFVEARQRDVDALSAAIEALEETQIDARPVETEPEPETAPKPAAKKAAAKKRGRPKKVIENVLSPAEADGFRVAIRDILGTLANEFDRRAEGVKLVGEYSKTDDKKLAGVPDESLEALRDRLDALMQEEIEALDQVKSSSW